MADRKPATDRIICTDCLNRQKYLSEVYNEAILKSSSSALGDTFSKIHREETENVERLFRQMRDRGWYRAKRANPTRSKKSNENFTPGETDVE